MRYVLNQLRQQGLVPQIIEEIWQQITERRESRGLPKVLDIDWLPAEGLFVLHLSQRGCRSYDNPDHFFQALLATQQEMIQLREWLRSPKNYCYWYELKQEKDALSKQLCEWMLEKIPSLRLCWIEPATENNLEWTREQWINKYQQPRFSCFDSVQTKYVKIEPMVSCMDNKTSVISYVVAGSRTSLVTLEDESGNVFARTIVYQDRSGYWRSLIYRLDFSELQVSRAKRALYERFCQDLEKENVRALRSPLAFLDPAPQFMPIWTTQMYDEKHCVELITLPYIDDPENSTDVISARWCGEALQVCRGAEAELAIWSSQRVAVPIPGDLHATFVELEYQDEISDFLRELWCQIESTIREIPTQRVNLADIRHHRTLREWRQSHKGYVNLER